MPKFEDRAIVGFTEPVQIINNSRKKQLRARIDTGATKSSIDSSVVNELKIGPVIGKKTIRNAHGRVRREVVEVTIQIAGKLIKEKFTVADRTHMTYPVLVGRNILRKGFLIDPNNLQYL